MLYIRTTLSRDGHRGTRNIIQNTHCVIQCVHVYIHAHVQYVYAFVKNDISNSLYSSNYALEGELQCMYTRIVYFKQLVVEFMLPMYCMYMYMYVCTRVISITNFVHINVEIHVCVHFKQ